MTLALTLPLSAPERKVKPVANDYVIKQLAAGEVLLIDTRQHWVAAIRYAIRPILIAGLAVLLSILNQWLKFDRLSFINDILHWIVLIGFLVAIVWLPIDLFRWWSRHYVLTNRRAIRLDGVVRKQSFDSSLEQINDILLSQSLLGRQLGYADLTLLTANASNEAYKQLLDGPQFKRAVLEAKEAIRSGHPLEALPDGFVVKGGTNEASISAVSKPAPAAEAASEAVTPAGAAGVAAVAGTTAAIVADDVPATQPMEDSGSADAPSVAEVMAEDEAFAEWPAPVEAEGPAGSAAGVEESAEVAASEVAVEESSAFAAPEVGAPVETSAPTESEPLSETAEDVPDAGQDVVVPDEPTPDLTSTAASSEGDAPAATEEDRTAL